MLVAVCASFLLIVLIFSVTLDSEDKRKFGIIEKGEGVKRVQ